MQIMSLPGPRRHETPKENTKTNLWFSSCGFVSSCFRGCILLLEIEAIDVAAIEEHRCAEDDLAVAHVDLPQASRLKRVRAGSQPVLCHEDAGVDGEVSEIAG